MQLDRVFNSLNAIIFPDPIEQRFVVVGNFATSGEELNEIFNVESGLSQEVFYTLMQDFAQTHNSQILHNFGHSVVMSSSYDFSSEIRALNGDLFSYAYINQVSLDAMIEAEKGPDDTFLMGENIPSEDESPIPLSALN